MRLGYGLGFVRIDQQAKDSFDVTEIISDSSYNDTSSSNSFIGLGPKATLGADFRILNNVYMVGEIGLSVLYGKSKAELRTGGTTIEGVLFIPSTHYKEENYQGALGFEGKVGLAYVAAMSEDIAVNLEVGFKGQSYVNALQDDQINAAVNPLAEIESDSVGFDGTYSNFGPYVNLSVDFM